MKKFIIIVLAHLLITTSIFAQTPEKMTYQAVIRNSSDALVTNTNIGMQISILQGTTSGTAVYVERQFPTTNANGLISLEIGSGTVVSGTFATIDWANGQYFIKTETDLNGGATYTISGTSQLLSVPYALHAKTAETVTGGITESDPLFTAWDKDYNDLTNKPTIPTIPSNVSAFTNDAGYIASYTETDPAFTTNFDFTGAANGDLLMFDGTKWVKLTPNYLSSYTETDPDFNAWNKNYNDLINLPTLFSGSFADLTNKPTTITGYGITDAYDGTWTSLTGKPNFATVATSGSYNDLTNKPDLTVYATTTDVNTALNNKVDKETGKGLSTEDYTTAEKTKLAGIEAEAQVNVNADWNSATGDSEILNKPDLTVYATTTDVNTALNNKVDKEAGKGLQVEGTQTGEMQYWDGTAWIPIAPGITGQVLTIINGEPTWEKPAIPTVGVTDVYNHATGKVWMDRNLGATRVAIAPDDYLAYGNSYQWGRLSDGHELIIWTSSTNGTFVNGHTAILSNSNIPGHEDFITSIDEPRDWLNPQNDNLWQGVDGINNPCPNGYRIPTIAEWEEEVESWISNNSAGAFASQLKLPLSGGRVFNQNHLFFAGSTGYYWSSTINDTYSDGTAIGGDTVSFFSTRRGDSRSVRCIKD